MRIRPKMMTLATTIIGLAPILWATGTGSDVMKRIAAPMVGGVVTSAILELLIYPVLFVMWKSWSLPKDRRTKPLPVTRDQAASEQGGQADGPPRDRRRWWLGTIIGLLGIGLLAIGGWLGGQQFARTSADSSMTGKARPFATQQTGGLTVTMLHPASQLRAADNEFFIEFADAASQPVDVGVVTFEIDMKMPGMVMHNAARVERLETPGRYRARLKVEMGGTWQATLKYNGPQGSGQAVFQLEIKR
jgi:hypothetical protein